MDLTKHPRKLVGSVLSAVVLCSQVGSAFDQKAYQDYQKMREDLAREICGDDPVCYQMAMDEADSVDNLVSIAQNSYDKGYIGTIDKMRTIK